MPEPSLEKLQNQCLAYGLAADDMSQAIAAAITLRDEEGNRNLDRALECAMTICYMRAFTSKLLTVSGKFVPSTDRGYSAQDVELHEWFEEHRDKAYAHTDEDSGRMATVIPLDDGSGGGAWSLIWGSLPARVDQSSDSLLRPPAGELSRQGPATARADQGLWARIGRAGARST